MQVLVASSISRARSDLLTETMRLRVHSVYRRALNFSRSGASGGPAVWATVALADVGNLPHGVLVPTLPDLVGRVQPGDTVYARDGCLDLGLTRVVMRGALLWDPYLPSETPVAGAREVEEAWRLAWEAAIGGAVAEFGPSVARATEAGGWWVRAEALLLRLVRGALTSDMAQVESAARGLVGLGPGLTPGGDDLLVGFVGACHALHSHAAGGPAVAALERGIRPRLSHTTDVAATYLHWALAGCLAERLTDLLEALMRGAPAVAVRRSVIRALAMGATSGRDTTLGALLGLAAGLARRDLLGIWQPTVSWLPAA